MKQTFAILLLLLCLSKIGLGVAESAELQLYSFPPNGTKLQIMREVMSLDWKSDPSARNDGGSPRAVMGKAILMKPTPGGVRPASDLGNIQRGSLYWMNFEQAYRYVVRRSENLPKNAALEVTRLVGSTIPNADDSYAATIAVRLMAMFQHASVPDTSILIGTLQPDGRVGPVNLLSEKLLLLLPFSQKLYIPSGQLVELDPNVINTIQQRQVTIEEVDTIEQAYQVMVRTQ